MLKTLRNLSLSLIAAATIFSFGLIPASAADCSSSTTPQDAAQCGIDTGSQSTNDAKTATTGVNNLISTILNILSVVVGIVAVIMIVVAGLKYVTSGGKDEGVKSAKNTLMYAIIGLVIVAVAQVMVHFVLKTSSGSCIYSKAEGYHYSISGGSCTP